MKMERWPRLILDDWLATYETLHRWTQIVGKTRLACAPFENHWWHCALYVTERGLGTSVMPYGGGLVEIEFDILDDALMARTSDGETRRLRLENKAVADFYREYLEMLATLGVRPRFVPSPNELPDATPFAEDREHATYDGDAARRWWRALIQADRVLKQFRSEFVGKCGPSHFWWGAFDLSCTRFSGRRAPLHPGGIPNCPDYVAQEGYSHECISAGWWPGVAGSPMPEAAFYAYVYPEPAGYSVATIDSAAAFYSTDLREWILPYESVRTADDPDAMLMRFLESTYETAARLAKWDIDDLRSAARDMRRRQGRLAMAPHDHAEP